MTSIWVLFVVFTAGVPVDHIQIASTTTSAVFKTEADCRSHIEAVNAYWNGVAAATPNATTHLWGAQCVKIEAENDSPKVGT